MAFLLGIEKRKHAFLIEGLHRPAEGALRGSSMAGCLSYVIPEDDRGSDPLVADSFRPLAQRLYLLEVLGMLDLRTPDHVPPLSSDTRSPPTGSLADVALNFRTFYGYAVLEVA